MHCHLVSTQQKKKKKIHHGTMNQMGTGKDQCKAQETGLPVQSVGQNSCETLATTAMEIQMQKASHIKQMTAQA